MSVQFQVHIGSVVRAAIAFNPANWRKGAATTSQDSLLATVQRLFALLEERQVPYALAGGVALLAYVEGRNTQDIDLIMAQAALKKVPEIRITHRGQDVARGDFEGIQIAILLTRNPLFARVLRNHVTRQRFAEREIPTATVDGLLLLKLYALPSLYRQGNFARVSLYENDIATLVHAYQVDLKPLLDTLTKYLSEGDIAELREIAADIERRIQRFRGAR